jgi:ATP-dependent Lon protease
MSMTNKKVLILPFEDNIVLPGEITPLLFEKKETILTIEQAIEEKAELAICLKENTFSKEKPHVKKYGVTIGILEVSEGKKRTIKALVEGKKKIYFSEVFYEENYLYAHYEESEEEIKKDSAITTQALWQELKVPYQKYREEHTTLSLLPAFDETKLEEHALFIHKIAASILFDQIEKKYSFLEFPTLNEKIAYLIKSIYEGLSIIEACKKVRENIQNQINISQRDFYLKEQLKAIQKELGIETEEELCGNLLISKAHDKKIPQNIIDIIEKEGKRLNSMQEFSSEASVIKNYLEQLIKLPWEESGRKQKSITEAKTILEESHYGLRKVKKTILEYIAALQYAGEEIKRPILCIVGPPGVGKTSLTRTIAKALNKKFTQIALGGLRDEAEIKGHRKTYIAAMPGRVIQAFQKAGEIDPVILFDEIDKMSQERNSDPSSALLEIFDYEQNNAFVDNFIEVPYDISKATFITTANHIENIPSPLLDRLEVIYVPGYNLQEKEEIAKSFLLPKITKEHGINSGVTFTDKAIESIILHYTKEAGVRSLQRLITKIIRKIIYTFLEESKTEEQKISNFTVKEEDISQYLSSAPYKNIIEKKEKKIGIVSGLAWTEHGGEIIEVEAALIDGGKGGIQQITGQIGEVMQESAQAALTYIKSQAKKLKIKKNIFDKNDFHIHVPEGATPKDGPSAGITLCTALTSILINKAVSSKIAMTGEISLQGKLLPIGGIKAKLLAAEAGNYEIVIFPHQNQDETLEIIRELPKPPQPKILYFKTVEEVFEVVFNIKL